MRKLIWGLLALMVVAACLVYLAASHAARQPASYVGQYATAAEFLARRCNPVALVQRLLQPARDVGPVVCQPIAEAAPALEARVALEEPPTILIDSVEPLEPIEVIVPHQLVIQVEAEESDEHQGTGQFAECPDDLPCFSAFAQEEARHVPAHMPYAHEQVPPYAYEAGEEWFHQSGLEWAGQCGRRLSQCFGNLCSWPDWLEEMPGADDAQETAATSSSAEEITDVHPCNAMETVAEEETILEPEFVDLTADDDSTQGDVPSDAAMAGPSDEQASPELLDPPSPVATPCREDPNIHHHYPGCPFTGRQTNPCQPPVKQMAKPNLEEELLAPTGLDTMECRPTDLEDSPNNDEPF